MAMADEHNSRHGVVRINATSNNTHITVSDAKGNVVRGGSWTCGRVGFDGPRRSTAFAAIKAASEAMKKLVEHKFSAFSIRVKGPGAGRDALKEVVKVATDHRIKVISIVDETSMPHNGVRKRAERRN